MNELLARLMPAPIVGSARRLVGNSLGDGPSAPGGGESAQLSPSRSIYCLYKRWIASQEGWRKAAASLPYLAAPRRLETAPGTHSMFREFALMIACLLCLAGGCLSAEVKLDSEVGVLHGKWVAETKTLSIGGKSYTDFAYSTGLTTFDLSAHFYERVKGALGISDECRSRNRRIELSVYLDGKEVWNGKRHVGEPAVAFDIPLKGAKTLTFNMAGGEGSPPAGYPSSAAGIAEPRLVSAGAPEPVKPTYMVMVNPRSIAELAKKLADRVPRSELRGGGSMQVAVSTFELVSGRPGDDLDPAVGRNVRNDLDIALLNLNPPIFHTVTREQLDAVLTELKFGESGLVDSEKAKKLGKMVQAQAVIIGSISDRDGFVVINAKLVDTETGESSIGSHVEMEKPADE
jgi:hypothetical protein